MKVKCGGYTYRIRMIDALMVVVLKIRLRVRRCRRRLQLVFAKEDLVLYSLVVVLWMIFAFFLRIVDTSIIAKDYSYVLELWKLRDSMFSTVVIAFFINSYNRVRRYRLKIRYQHYVYTDALSDFEALLDSFNNEEIRYRYHPLYNEITYKYTRDINGGEFSLFHIDNELLTKCASVKERLLSIENDFKSDGLIVVEKHNFFLWSIESSKSKMNRILKSCSLDDDCFDDMIYDLLQVLDGLRFPWRRDRDLDDRILGIIYRNKPCDVERDFYNRMFLSGFCFEMIYNSDVV